MEAEALVGHAEALARGVDRTAALEGVFRREYDAMLRLAHLAAGSADGSWSGLRVDETDLVLYRDELGRRTVTGPARAAPA
jgi:hypothetical protein